LAANSFQGRQESYTGPRLGDCLNIASRRNYSNNRGRSVCNPACFPASKTDPRVPQCWPSGNVLESSIKPWKCLAHYFWEVGICHISFSASFGRDTCPCKMRFMDPA